MWLGIAISIGALIGWLSIVWFDQYLDDDTSIRFSLIGTFWSCWCAHFGMLAMLPLTRDAGRIVRVLTIISTSILATTLSLIVLAQDADDFVFRFVAVLSILASRGTIVAPIPAIVEWLQTRGTQESMPNAFRITLQCPRCGSEEQMRTGVSTCSSCGLRIEINVQEPRCEGCGYLLYRLEGDACPECGLSIPREKRWVAAQTNDTPGEVDSEQNDAV